MNHHNFDSVKPALTKSFSNRAAMGFILRLLYEYPAILGGVIVLGIIAALSELLTVALVWPFVQSLQGGDAAQSPISTVGAIDFMARYFQDLELVEKIRWIALALLGAEIVKGSARYLSGRLSNLLQIRVDRSIRMKLFDQLMEVGLGFIHREKVANLFTILNNYSGHTSRIALYLATVVPDIFLALISVTLLVSLSVPMTLISIVLATLTAVAIGRIIGKARTLGSECNRAGVRLNHLGFELLSGITLIRQFAREGDVRVRFKDSVDDLQVTGFKRGLLEAAISPVSTTLLVLVAAMLLVAATYILHGQTEFWLGLVAMFLFVFSRLGGPLGRINLLRTQWESLMPSVHSVMEFLETEDKQRLPEGERVFNGLKSTVTFENVGFSYDSAEGEVLSDVSFEIPKGKYTAIVGGSGSGKSTIMALLSRLYDPTSGRILVDGMDLREFKAGSWRSKIGVVSQSTFLFNDTLRNNIRFGRPEATDDQIMEAARKANAYDFITRMKNGLDTLLGDRGVRLSGGQAQRVAIARAVLVDPEILILDEATSALDTASERLVQEALDRVSRDRTVVAVAHRLSTIRDADNIIVLENGQVVEQGTHRELVANRGAYWKYVQMQDLVGSVVNVEIPSQNDEPEAEIEDGEPRETFWGIK